MGSKHVYYNVPLVGVGVGLFGIVIITSIVVGWVLLRLVASDSRDFSDQNVEGLKDEMHIASGTIRKRLEKMQFWPIAWPSQTETIAIIVFMALSFISYRLLLFPMVLGISFLLMSLWPKRKGST